jgi:hypothetical protein
MAGAGMARLAGEEKRKVVLKGERAGYTSSRCCLSGRYEKGKNELRSRGSLGEGKRI